MKTPTRFPTGALVLLTAGMVFTTAVAGTDRARTAIESQTRALAQASQRGDAAAMANLFTADAKINVPGTIVAGRTAIQGFWQAALNGGMKGLSLTSAEIEGSGGLRFETGRYLALGANGAELGSGEYLLVWKQEGGAWKIHRDYGHPGAPPAANSVQPVAQGRNSNGFPANYRFDFAPLGVAFNERSSEITATYANATAASVDHAARLPYPEGAVFLMEFASSRRDGEGQLMRDAAGNVLKGEILHVDVMRKTRVDGSAANPQDAGWEFASYRADGSVAITPANAAHCADCHRNAGAAKDFVFRQRAPLTR